MGRVLIRRTYPCSTQESIELEGPLVDTKTIKDDNILRQCPQHGANCHKGAGQAGRDD